MMKFWPAIFAVIVFYFPLACAQQASGDAGLFSSDLVAWSFMQAPQAPEHKPSPRPTPDPVPETQPSPNPTPQPPSTPSKPGQGDTQNRTAEPQTFTGTISKEANNFVLRVSAGTSYKLDNQQQVQQYEGQRVRVTGTLDSSINLIHVDRIEPIS
jgi:Protein of unknown function (DUF5818)